MKIQSLTSLSLEIMNLQKLGAYQPNKSGSESVLGDSNGMVWA